MATNAQKPRVKLSGMDGNVFVLLGACRRALRKAGLNAQVDELSAAVTEAGSYDEALQAMMRFCDVR